MENNEIKLAYGDKLKGKLFGLLKEREKHGEWESFLETIEIELLGLEVLSMNSCIDIIHRTSFKC